MSRNKNGGYSGSGTFTFEVDRFKTEDGQLLTEEEAELVDNPDELEHVVVALTISGHAYYTPGVYLSAPEDCYPDESEVEIEDIEDEDGNSWKLRQLTKYEQDKIKEEIVFCAKDDDGDYYEPEYDHYDDAYFDSFEG